MSGLRILTAGESHGQCLTGIIEGLPAGLTLDRDEIDFQLWRRQQGCGRGKRMDIESDKIEILSGVRFGLTTGAPVSLRVINKDWENWKEKMSVWEGKKTDAVSVPRPGHADLAGAHKYGHSDIRNVLERASARETAMRVAIGSVCRQLLHRFDMIICGHVIQIGSVKSPLSFRGLLDESEEKMRGSMLELAEKAEKSPVSCADALAAEKMIAEIEKAAAEGDSTGGVFETAALNVPAGLGSYAMWDRRLEACIASDIMSIPAVKSVEVGLGADCALRMGSAFHDPVIKDKKGKLTRLSNRAGGIEGGISNGMPIVIRAAMKPIPTLTRPLQSVDLQTGLAADAHKERTDSCAVPAASVIAESMLCISLAGAVCGTYGSDTVAQIEKQIHG